MWGIVPPDGWHFYEGQTRIESDSHEGLVAALRSYRITNNFSPGEPEKEIDRYVCGKWPHVCGAGWSPNTIVEDEASKRPLLSLSQRVAHWAANRYSRLGSLDYIPTEEAERRTSICLECPQNNARWRQETIGQCGKCKEQLDALDVLLLKIRQGKEVSRSKRLGACATCGHDNQTAVHLSQDFLRHAKHYFVPSKCWLEHSQKISGGTTN